MIIVGSLLITPVAIFYILCGTPIDASGFTGKSTAFVIGIMSIIVGTIGLVGLKKKKDGIVSESCSQQN